MSNILQEVLKANGQYSESFGEKGQLALPPARHFAVKFFPRKARRVAKRPPFGNAREQILFVETVQGGHQSRVGQFFVIVLEQLADGRRATRPQSFQEALFQRPKLRSRVAEME